MKTKTIVFAVICVVMAACSNSSKVEVVAQGVDDQNVFVEIKGPPVPGPIRAEATNGVIHIWVEGDGQQAPPAVCETNWANGTIRIAVKRPAPKADGTIQIFLDGQSLGDWGR